MKTKLPQPKVHLLELDRLVFLIDGVFAITLTLLVLDLKLPEQSEGSLLQALQGMLPRLTIYLLAFATIANQWSIHHRTFRWVRHADQRLVQLSLINLLFITLLPATAAIVGGHPGDRLAAACFSVNGILLALSAWAIWEHVAARNHLLAEDADPRLLSGIARVWLYVALGYGLAIGAGLLNVYAEYALWVLWSPLVTLWWARRRQQMGL
jgi:uncharacterized membrane protein